MNLEKRFIARGSAVALSGFIEAIDDKPVNSIVPVTNASCSLPVSGGASESSTGPDAFPREGSRAVAFEACYSRAWQEARDGARTTLTRSEVKRLEIGTGPTLALDRAAVQMRSEHPDGAREPAIDLVGLEPVDLRLDRATLRVTFLADLASRYRTREELRRAYEQDDEFYKRLSHCFVGSEPAKDQRRQLAEHKGYTPMCLVDNVTWIGEPHPDVEAKRMTFNGHVITWTGFGRIYLGEMLVSQFARRFTLLRVRLGSPIRGELSACEVETNGVTFP